jgi:hypothetical protein
MSGVMQHTDAGCGESAKVTPVSFAVDLSSSLASDSQHSKVAYVVHALKRHHNGKGFFDDPWTVIPFSFAEIEELQRQIRADSDLQGFVDDKVRYVLYFNYLAEC